MRLATSDLRNLEHRMCQSSELLDDCDSTLDDFDDECSESGSEQKLPRTRRKPSPHPQVKFEHQNRYLSVSVFKFENA
jgi:hypothetical protein